MNALRFRLKIFILTFLIILLTGVIGFISIEGLAFIDALYFTIVTIATVGYGDIHPVTYAGKLLSLILIICGVGTFLGVVANATDLFLSKREEKIRIQKVNMALSLFFSEAGTQLLRIITTFDPELESIRNKLIVTNQWDLDAFKIAQKKIKNHTYKIDIHKGNLQELSGLLKEKQLFLLTLLTNPILMEHEVFTDLLRALFHLGEEFEHRDDLKHLPDNDYQHLSGDINRVYVLLVQEWFTYIQYLKGNYPYLFSLAIRSNPFNANASVIFQ